MIRAALIGLILTAVGTVTGAVTCNQQQHLGAGYTVCEVDVTVETLELFLRDPDGAIFGQFTIIDRFLGQKGKQLSFAMNAGMYHDDRAPVGHYVEDGQEVMRVITSAGPGNFGLLPNGILCLRPGRADVIETKTFVAQNPKCTDATQSGPMLVIDGSLHPRFLEDGTSMFIRNGVGTSADGTRAVFVISDEPVNFYSFGTFFRDVLGVPNALYFDGKVSRLYAPQLNRSDFGFALGPIIGVVEDTP